MASTPGATAAGGESREPATTAVPADEPDIAVENHGLLVAGIMLAAILPILDTTIANVAIPHMQSALGAGPQTVMWVLTSYIVTNAIAMPLTGWLSERLGRHRLYLLSTAAFIVTSALCGLSQNLEQMVIFRALQGLAGAFIFPLSQSILLDTSRPSRHSSMMALLSLGMVLGPVLGPIIGGWLTENWNWRWVFLVNIPLGVVSLFLLISTLPRYERADRKFDLYGFGLIAVCLASLQLLLDRGQHVDWFDAAESWIYLGICLATFWMTLVHLMTSPNPLFERAMFADRNFLIAFVFMTINAMVVYTTMALMPPMLQNLFGYDVVDTGLVIAPRGVGAIFAMQIANQLIMRQADPRYLIGAGYLVTIYSLHVMSSWSLDVDQWAIIWNGLIQGVGIGLISLPMFVIAFATLEPRLRTDASGLLNLGRLIGSSVGISIVTALFARNLQVSHSDLAAHVTSSSSDAVDVAAVSRYQELGETVMSLANAEINRQAAMVSYIDDFWIIMWATILTFPLVFLLRSSGSGAAPDPTAGGGH